MTILLMMGTSRIFPLSNFWIYHIAVIIILMILYIIALVLNFYSVFPPLFTAFSPLSSVQFSHSVVSNSLGPHELQHARPPCPDETPILLTSSKYKYDLFICQYVCLLFKYKLPTTLLVFIIHCRESIFLYISNWSPCLVKICHHTKMLYSYWLYSPYCTIHCSSLVAQSCPRLCDPMNCNTTGFHVLQHLLELAQIPVHWASDAI